MPLTDLPPPLGARIGPDWPRRFAAHRGVPLVGLPRGGVVPDLSVLGIPVDPLAPAVRSFFEETAIHPLVPDVDARPWVRWGLILWGRWIASRWGQLRLPTRSGTAVGNAVYDVGGVVVWVRGMGDDAMYVCRADPVPLPDGGRGLRIAFPIPWGAWAVILRPEVHAGSVTLDQRSRGTGHWFVPRWGPSVRLWGLRESITVAPDGPDTARAEHCFRWFGATLLVLAYSVSCSDAA